MNKAPTRRLIDLPCGERAAYFEAGSGPDVLLVHGAFVTSHDMLVSLMEPLAQHFHVIAVDRPGHGLSTRPRLAGAPRRQAALIMEAVRALGLRRPIVIGQSFGGAVALEFALRFPDEIAAVIAIAPMAFPEPRLEHLLFGYRAAPLFGDIATLAGGAGPDAAMLPLMWRAMFLPQDMPDAFRDTMAFDEVRSGRGLQANGEDATALLALAANIPLYGACRVPVSILYGDRDVVVNPALHARTVARLLGQGRAQRVVGAGHMLHHFHADLVVGLALKAAAKLDGRAAGLSKTG